MKVQSDALIAEKQKQNVTTFWLVKMDGVIYITNCDQEIVYNGDTYHPYPLKLSGFKSADGSPLDGGTIQIGNVDLTMSSLVLNNRPPYGPPVTVYEAWFDESMSLIAAEVIGFGKIDGRPALDENWCTVNISGQLNAWTQRYPRTRITRANFPFLPLWGKTFTWGSTIITIE